MRLDYANLTSEWASGEGVLSRLTVTVVGTGVSALTLDSEIEGLPHPVVIDAASNTYEVSQQQNAVIAVGQSCADVPLPTQFDPFDPTPAPTPVATPTPETVPTPIVSTVPAGDTQVSVDTITTGNTATSFGDIDECASATNGETFQVDIVIQDVQDLLGWEGPISYDHTVLRILDRDVKLFQAANEGSQVFDASNQTPNDTGLYRAAAVDQADPQAPDSGDGVLIRLTIEAVGEGTSQISLSPVDLNGDGTPETGLVLKNIDNIFIGGATFPGPLNDGEIRVGADCEGGGSVIQTQGPTGNGTTDGDDDGGGSGWVWIVVGAIIAVVAVAGAARFLMRRGSGTPS
jgi:hypothetical protein